MHNKRITLALALIGFLTLIFISCGNTTMSSTFTPLEQGVTYNIRMVGDNQSSEMKVLGKPNGDWIQVEWAGEPAYININNIVVIF